ncbi:MAG: hypothetical protein ACRDWD_09045 [Acidimicrobiia bacterium]
MNLGHLAALVVAVSAAACSSPGRQSREGFTDEASGICTDANARIGAIAAPDPADPELVANAVSQIIAVQRTAVDDLDNLRPPEGVEPQVDAWLDHLNDVLDEEENVAEAVRAGDPDAATEANAAAAAANTEAEALATELELTACTMAGSMPAIPPVPPGTGVPATDPGLSTSSTSATTPTSSTPP